VMRINAVLKIIVVITVMMVFAIMFSRKEESL
jgi:hypothetical protein